MKDLTKRVALAGLLVSALGTGAGCTGQGVAVRPPPEGPRNPVTTPPEGRIIDKEPPGPAFPVAARPEAPALTEGR